MDKALDALLKQALAARLNAHAPYSKFKVGAALKTKDAALTFEGCNVENASFGATVCAERNAIGQMVSKIGKSELESLVVVTDMESPATPCALCLQVLAEFNPGDLKIYLANLQGIKEETTLKALLPRAFTEF